MIAQTEVQILCLPFLTRELKKNMLWPSQNTIYITKKRLQVPVRRAAKQVASHRYDIVLFLCFGQVSPGGGRPTHLVFAVDATLCTTDHPVRLFCVAALDYRIILSTRVQGGITSRLAHRDF